MDAAPPEPEPGPEPMDMDPEPECIEPDNAFYTEFYPGASEPIGRGQTFREVFDEGGYAAESKKSVLSICLTGRMASCTLFAEVKT